MPIYDRRCPDCAHIEENLLERFSDPDPACPACGAPMARTILGKSANVIGDEMDHVQVNGCKTPIRFRSKYERKVYLKSHGWAEAGHDKCDAITQYTLDAAKALVERVGNDKTRGWRDPDKAPIGITSEEGLVNYMRDVRAADHGTFGFSDR